MNDVLESTRTTRLVSYSPEWRDQVLDLARQMHAEANSYRNIPFDEQKLSDRFNLAVLMPDLVYLRLVVRGQEAIGAMFGCIDEMLCSKTRALWDQGWYVKPEHRGGRAAIMLIKDWEAWGVKHGVRRFHLSQTTNVDIASTTKLMTHLGYQVIGLNTFKEL